MRCRSGGPVGRIFASIHYWRIMPVAAVGIGASAAYQSLWVVPWLRDIAGFDRQGQALGLFVILAGSVVGNFGFGALSQVLGRRGIPLVVPALIGLLGCMAIQALLAFGHAVAVLPIWFAFGGNAASAASHGQRGNAAVQNKLATTSSSNATKQSFP